MTQLKRKDKDDSETSHFNLKEIIREPNVSVHGACQSAAYYATLNRASRLGGCGCFEPFFHFMAVLFSSYFYYPRYSGGRGELAVHQRPCLTLHEGSSV